MNKIDMTHKPKSLLKKTHCTSSINSATVGSTGGRLLWNIPEFGHRIQFDAVHDCETCGSVHYGDAKATVPACHLYHHFLCKTCTVTLCPGGTNPWRIKPTMSQNSRNFLPPLIFMIMSFRDVLYHV
jgi:hypothetical protein